MKMKSYSSLDEMLKDLLAEARESDALQDENPKDDEPCSCTACLIERGVMMTETEMVATILKNNGGSTDPMTVALYTAQHNCLVQFYKLNPALLKDLLLLIRLGAADSDMIGAVIATLMKTMVEKVMLPAVGKSENMFKN